MKRIALTPRIEASMRRSLGVEANLSQYPVFEAIALNTQPLRKLHPIYKNARMDLSVLYELVAVLNTESRPVQIQHDTGVLPIGRVFHGEVDAMNEELRVLFFVDPTEVQHITKIENGTVDQVSVSVLTKQVLNSVSGFDYLGTDAGMDNWFSGEDNDGNILGVNGCHARLVGLDSFFEMSIVGQGAARNARIVNRNDSYFGSSYQQLAASGTDPSVFVLSATASERKPQMDLSELVTKLTAKEIENHDLTKTNATQATDLASAQARIEELEGQLAAAEAEKTVDVAQLTSDRDAAVGALKNVAAVMLTASGKASDALPETTAELATLIDDTKTSLAAKIVAGGVALSADQSEVKKGSALPASNAFRVNRK